MLPKEPYKRIPVILLYAAAAMAAVWLAVRYALPALSPFIFAYLLASLLQPLMRRIRGGRAARRIAAAAFVLLASALFAGLCALAAARIYRELSSLARDAAGLIDRARSDPGFAAGIIKRIDSAVPFLDIEDWLTGVWKDVDARLGDAAIDVISAVSSAVLPALGALVSFLPGAFLYAFVLALSSYYMTVGYENVNRALASLVPGGARKYAAVCKSELHSTLPAMLRAYAILFLMTFAELFASLSLIGAEYPLAGALLIAAFDILPVLGAGMILAPWGIGALLFGDTARGLALLIAFGIMTVIREIAEPRLVAKSVGLPPLPALIAMYAGLKLFGVWGMIFAPPAAAVCRSVVSSVRRAAAQETD